MKLQITAEELSKRKLFICAPCYGGMMCGLTAKSFLDLQTVLNQYKIEHRFSFLFNESLITRARNYLTDEFLRSEGFTHMLFIDSDIYFNPVDVITLLAMDKDVCGGPYPKKTINWTNIQKAIVRNPDIATGELDALVGDYVFNPVAGTTSFNVAEPLEVMEIGTGFMMIKREVFDAFKEAYPEQTYRPDHHGQQNFDGTRYIHAYFDCYIDRGKSDRYLSEDYAFCQRVRAIGKKVWLCPWMCSSHVGSYPFAGNLPKVAEMCGSL